MPKMLIVTEKDGSRWVNLDDVIQFIESSFLESCACDRDTAHDCVCPNCKLRFFASNDACIYCRSGDIPVWVSPLMGDGYYGHLVFDYGPTLKTYEKCLSINEYEVKK